MTAKDEVRKRVWESQTALQWYHLAQEHRNAQADGAPRIPEKEFLLIYAHQVDANPQHASENNPWIGNEVIVKVDRQHHRPRLRFDHVVWSSLLPPGGGLVPPPPPPASGWDINAPAFMAGPP